MKAYSKAFLVFLVFAIASSYTIKAQQVSCAEIIDYVKSKSYGTTYYSYTSEAIRQVTFYQIMGDNYRTYYFAIVQFTSSYKEYIYQVGSNTKFNYSLEYLDSAGKAFWNYIQPYNQNLGCAPDLD